MTGNLMAIVFGRATALQCLGDAAHLAEPSTLLWSASILGVPLAIVVACRRPVSHLLDILAERTGSRATRDFWAYRAQFAYRDPGWRRAAFIALWAALVLGCCWAVTRAAAHGSDQPAIMDLAPGPMAAAALLLAPAIALLIATGLVLITGLRCGALLRSSRLLPVLWSLGAAVGCANARTYAPEGMSSMWVVAAVLFAVVGLALITAPADGGTTLTRAKEARAAARLEFAQAALRTRPAEGEYLWPSRFVIGDKLRSLIFIPATVLRRVRWDEHGLEIHTAAGKPTRHPWDQVISVKVNEFVQGFQGADVALSDGTAFHAPASGRHFRELVSAVQARVWLREQEAKSERESLRP